MDTILIIEDDRDLREGLEYTLKGEGYHILTAENAGKGLAAWKQSDCDLIILDCNLPDGNGFDLCSKIRETSDVFLLMLTARDSEIDEVKALEMGVDDYMSKPFSIAVLKARIKKLLARKKTQQRVYSNGICLDKSSCQVICNDDNTVSVNIRRLRKKIEEDPKNPKYIQTIHGLGYIWREEEKR